MEQQIFLQLQRWLDDLPLVGKLCCDCSPVSHLSVSPVSSRNKKKEKKRKRKSAFCHHTDAQGWIVRPHVGVRAHMSPYMAGRLSRLLSNTSRTYGLFQPCVCEERGRRRGSWIAEGLCGAAHRPRPPCQA